jgi:lipopolysaccharide export system permease protein
VRRRFVRPLDRYVFAEFWKIFMVTALGFPFLVILIDLVEKLDSYLERHLSIADIALSYVYAMPDTMFNVLPAAVLFATVFAIGAFTRNSEITAAKASGVSFYRFIAPIAFGSLMASVGGLVLGELAPIGTQKAFELRKEKKSTNSGERVNFVFAGEGGRVYKAVTLSVEQRAITGLQVERRGNYKAKVPGLLMNGEAARWTARRGWVVKNGLFRVLPTDSTDISIHFDSMIDRRMQEQPRELLASPKAPQEMRYQELGRFIAALERSGADVKGMKVDRMLKLAIPATCMVIFLFGAPLATSTQRGGGAALGVAISLGTTIIFLVLIQLTRAIGAKGLVDPGLAAWIPSLVFGSVGLVLLSRART